MARNLIAALVGTMLAVPALAQYPQAQFYQPSYLPQLQYQPPVYQPPPPIPQYLPPVPPVQLNRGFMCQHIGNITTCF